MSADRSRRAVKANDSGSWNKYSYTRGDPINRVDRQGTEDYCTDDYCCEDGDDCDEDPCNEDPSLCDGGGGPQKPKKPAKPAKSPRSIQSELDRALKADLKALANKPDCDALFALTPGSPDPSTLLQRLFAGIQIGDIVSPPNQTTSATTIGTGPYSSPIGNGATQLLYTGVTITINDLAGSFVSGTAQDQAVTLLHELGHAYDFMYGPNSTTIKTDGTDVNQSMANSASVRQNCFN